MLFAASATNKCRKTVRKNIDKHIKERYNDNSWNGYYPIFIPAAFLPKTTNNNVNTMN